MMIHARYMRDEQHQGLLCSFNLFNACFLFTCCILFFSLPALGQMEGSAHDFSSYSWSGGQLCEVCHVSPDHGNTTRSVPLWNHRVSKANYVLYESRTLAQTPEQPSYANVSRLCLSCHDGTIAVDAFGEKPGSMYITGGSSMGIDLSNDHPIGVGRIGQRKGNPGAHGSGVKYYAGKVECPSCHEVHNNQVKGRKLLRVSMKGSALCYQCHDK
jgi:predicted CXXCH cytochrome family protein